MVSQLTVTLTHIFNHTCPQACNPEINERILDAHIHKQSWNRSSEQLTTRSLIANRPMKHLSNMPYSSLLADSVPSVLYQIAKNYHHHRHGHHYHLVLYRLICPEFCVIIHSFITFLSGLKKNENLPLVVAQAPFSVNLSLMVLFQTGASCIIHCLYLVEASRPRCRRPPSLLFQII